MKYILVIICTQHILFFSAILTSQIQFHKRVMCTFCVNFRTQKIFMTVFVVFIISVSHNMLTNSKFYSLSNFILNSNHLHSYAFQDSSNYTGLPMQSWCCETFNIKSIKFRFYQHTIFMFIDKNPYMYDIYFKIFIS